MIIQLSQARLLFGDKEFLAEPSGKAERWEFKEFRTIPDSLDIPICLMDFGANRLLSWTS